MCHYVVVERSRRASASSEVSSDPTSRPCASAQQTEEGHSKLLLTLTHLPANYRPPRSCTASDYKACRAAHSHQPLRRSRIRRHRRKQGRTGSSQASIPDWAHHRTPDVRRIAAYVPLEVVNFEGEEIYARRAGGRGSMCERARTLPSTRKITIFGPPSATTAMW